MRPEARVLLADMKRAAEDVSDFTRGKTLLDYQRDRQLRYSVERGFEIIGEALS